jgi:methylglyoxal/glyoxal reductase
MYGTNINPTNITNTIKLRDGIDMPIFGIGTWLSKKGGDCKNAVENALKVGYRLIDTAQLYDNEEDVGEAIENSGVKRDDLFIVTKLHSLHHKDNDEPIIELCGSLNKLKTRYVDLYLIHTPKGGNLIEVWKGMLDSKRMGLTRAVGVSNFGIEQLQGLKDAGLEMPEVNQIELHVWLQQKEVVEWCRKENIAVMGYCPLAKTNMFGKTDVKNIAEEIGKTESQVAIRWSIQSEIITIPKSINMNRIKENSDVFNFELSEENMKRLNECDIGYKASLSANNMYIPWDKVKSNSF